MRVLVAVVFGLAWAAVYTVCTFLPIVIAVWLVVTVLRWMGVLN